jgi:hypothetical protein
MPGISFAKHRTGDGALETREGKFRLYILYLDGAERLHYKTDNIQIGVSRQSEI